MKITGLKMSDVLEKYNIPIKFQYFEPNDMLDLTIDGEYFGDRCDCSTRSMVCLTGESYETILEKQLDYTRKTKDNYNSTIGMEIVLSEYGYHMVKLRKPIPNLFTTILSLDEDEYICILNNHAICIKNKTIYDNVSEKYLDSVFERLLYERVNRVFIKNKPGEEYPKLETKIIPYKDDDD